MLLIILLLSISNPHADFINRFSLTAQSEYSKFGIPASVKLGQAILESGGGKSRAFSMYNNAFGLQCKLKQHTDCCALYNDAGTIVRIRKFNCAWDGFRAHSIHITNGRYADMPAVCGNNPYLWAVELQRRGYSTTPDYASRLTRVINHYNLTQYDSPVAER